SAGDDQRLRLQPVIVGFDADMLVASIEIGRLRVRETSAKFLGLPMHIKDKLRSIDSIWETGRIFHQCRGRELSAWLPPFQHQRAQISAGSVNRRRQSGAAAPDDNYFLHR